MNYQKHFKHLLNYQYLQGDMEEVEDFFNVAA